MLRDNICYTGGCWSSLECDTLANMSISVNIEPAVHDVHDRNGCNGVCNWDLNERESVAAAYLEIEHLHNTWSGSGQC